MRILALQCVIQKEVRTHSPARTVWDKTETDKKSVFVWGRRQVPASDVSMGKEKKKNNKKKPWLQFPAKRETAAGGNGGGLENTERQGLV